ncbi:M17 family metallopeptidase [Mesomycoplasma ovipneumoniae]|uniref:Probable cytosol aminopeptidase n=1 Tax=Mesomycoplasma ovipneumoniae TaxID=29562 RepID=A0AAW6Q3Z6_9BACT|nr:leucyl aminopeptidase [Mesomycoplasma ovipneumoniae]MDF9627421.1 leucyl aminopeptidase [Mesomycoplasma ovipneumoniae]MDO4157468.1 leucyl aminopeptidase [Mesomycoplasma ovipneumoniae]MDO4158554.1 leucyl aminopeptidase [Mesomycoplasma ovipneumoniae]MDO6821475.1 leucyl aminopeptidase [Mesomycoplasma ovipneumoniae]MDO6826051.1 leucyl aminopeptidase [Mesomycoplasma ovipneumoniae]
MKKFSEIFVKYSNKFESNRITIEPVYFDSQIPMLLKEDLAITEYLGQNKAYINLGSRTKEFTPSRFRKIAQKLANYPRDIQIDFDKFPNSFLRYLIEVVAFVRSDIFSLRAEYDKQRTKYRDILVVSSYLDELKPIINKYQIINNAVNYARYYQNIPPNIASSEFLAAEIQKKISQNPKLTVKVLGESEIRKLGMNLLLAVNRGSTYDAKLVVISYDGLPGSQYKTAFVGKGITFDSGGYNIKTGMYMNDMKYDMSGAIICAAAIDALSQFNPLANVVAVLPLTDNRLNGDANTPDSVWKSKNGKTVEINNTDAEGRLILADAITYAIREENATEIISVATLTGAIRVALGETFTGAFANDDKIWKSFNEASKEAGELIWRMPLHLDFAQNIRDSKVADLKNTDFSGKAGSSSAAMFIAEFVEDKPFLHLDIAATAFVRNLPTGVMVKTLVEYILTK